MKIKYHPEASKDIDEAFEWYDSQKSGLGLKFISEAEATVYRILNFPELHPLVFKNLRRAILPIFPYGVIYSVESDTIEVYALAHLHRLPLYWKKRVLKK
jgi:toxin ParE1/3/4